MVIKYQSVAGNKVQARRLRENYFKDFGWTRLGIEQRLSI